MTTYVYNWPTDLPVIASRWDSEPGVITMQSLTDGSIYSGGGHPRATVSVKGRAPNAEIAASLSILLADLNGGRNLILLSDFNRGMFTFNDYYQAPPAGVQGEVLWQSDAGANYYWIDSGAMQRVWLAGLTLGGGGQAENNVITMTGGYPGATIRRGHTLLIRNRRFIVKADKTFNGSGQVNSVPVAPRFPWTVSGNDRIIYPGEVGIFHLTGYTVPEYDHRNVGDWEMRFTEVFEDEYPEGLTYVV